MKNIFKTSLLLACGVAFLASCNDDNDSNPIMQEPASFKLNTPAYAGSVIDLATSEGLNFTWSQPDYGYPAATEYGFQVSPTGKFTVSYDQEQADADAQLKADYAAAGSAMTVVSGTLDAADMATALEQTAKWEENAVPATTAAYVRLYALTKGADTIYSNTVQVNVAPYYVELKDAAPDFWYLTGACVGDGSWGSEVGTGCIPMFTVAGQEYDKKTGKGTFAYTGYFTTDGFKLKHTPDSWDEQWGYSDGAFVKNDGGSSNITPAANGYYTLTYDEAADKVTIEAYTGTVKVYDKMLISGNFNEWATTTEMTAVDTYTGAENHIWKYTLTLTEDGSVKFLQDANWTTNWGSSDFPYGVGTQGGKDIPVKAGTYLVLFNDITGSYSFIAQ